MSYSEALTSTQADSTDRQTDRTTDRYLCRESSLRRDLLLLPIGFGMLFAKGEQLVHHRLYARGPERVHVEALVVVAVGAGAGGLCLRFLLDHDADVSSSNVNPDRAEQELLAKERNVRRIGLSSL